MRGLALQRAGTSMRSRNLRFRLRGTLEANSALRLGIGLFAFMLIAGIVLPQFLTAPNEQDLRSIYLAPGESGHLLGTDGLGRDVFAWCVSGIRTSLTVGLATTALSALIGVTVGLVAGYFSGAADAVLMRLVDLQLAVPPLVLFLAASATIPGGMTSVILLISIVSWVPYARLVRARVLSEREQPYIAAARLAGASRLRILFVHLTRATATVVLIFASLQVGYVMLWDSGLSFLGLGIQPPQTSLGYMIAEGRANLVGAWWVAVFPGITIVLLIVASGMIGDGLRDWFQDDTVEVAS